MHIYTTQSPYFQLIILYIVATLNVSDSDTHTHTLLLWYNSQQNNIKSKQKKGKNHQPLWGAFTTPARSNKPQFIGEICLNWLR